MQVTLMKCRAVANDTLPLKTLKTASYSIP